MFTNNPFAALSGFLSPSIIQGYVVLMILLVVVGTLFDIVRLQEFRFDQVEVPLKHFAFHTLATKLSRLGASSREGGRAATAARPYRAPSASAGGATSRMSLDRAAGSAPDLSTQQSICRAVQRPGR